MVEAIVLGLIILILIISIILALRQRRRLEEEIEFHKSEIAKAQKELAALRLKETRAKKR